MDLYSGGLIIGRIFASEIWGAYFIYYLFIYLFIYFFFWGGGGLLSEFYGMVVSLRSWRNIVAREAMAAEPPILAAKPREASGCWRNIVALEAMAAEPREASGCWRNIVALEAMAAEPREASGEAARFQSGSFPFSSRLRRPYSLSAVKILPRTRTIPPATQAIWLLASFCKRLLAFSCYPRFLLTR